MPVGRQRPGLGRQFPARRQHRSAIGSCDCTLPDDDHRAFGVTKHRRELVRAVEQRRQSARPVADPGRVVGQFGRGADHCHGEGPGHLPLADARVQQRRFPAGIAANDQQRVRFLDPGDGCVERVEIPPRPIDPRAILAAIEIARAEQAHEVLQRDDAFRVHEIAGDRPNPLARHPMQLFSNGVERFGPGRLTQLPIAPHPGGVEPPTLQAIDGKA